MGRQVKHACRYRISPLDARRIALQLAITAAYERALKTRNICIAKSHPPMYLPRMDILDDPSSTRIVATFELPGIRSDQINLSLHQGIMQICGRRVPRTLHECIVNPTAQTSSPSVDNPMPSDSNFDQKKYSIQELRYGPFKRQIQLPHGIKEGDIMASLKDGLLTVTWPRHPNPVAIMTTGEEVICSSTGG